MASTVVTIRVRREILEFVDEMIRYGLASSRNEALNKLIARGVEEVRKELERRKRIHRLVKMFEEQGGIILPAETNVLKELGRD